MTRGQKLALCAGAAVIAAAVTANAQPAQKVTGPIATYWMSAQTTSGFGMPAMGGGRPDTGAVMRAMMGGGQANKTLTLQLGSRTPASAPAAEHVPPPGLQAGASLPLLSPRIEKVERPEPERPEVPPQFQQPRGKMLIFWGCGERARAGQPVVIDFAQMAKNPQAMAGLLKTIDVRPMQPPAPGRSTTYGEWPNERTRTHVPPNGSLVGGHLIHGNYTPDIEFKLGPDQDFLSPINLTTNAKAPGGWVNLGWSPVPNARAYLITAFGGNGETVVMWTSSETQAQAFGMPDYISPGELTRLVNARTLLSPQATSCAVPKEFVDAAGQGMMQMTAYGGEANFVHPPRPADPKVAWNQEWQVKVRYRSQTGGILGMPTPAMGGADDDERPAAQRPGQRPAPGQQPPRRPSATDILKGLGGLPFPR